MTQFYKSLALSYRAWDARMTPVGWEHIGFGPAGAFAALHATNIFSLTLFLLLLFPNWEVHPWALTSLPLAVGFALAYLNVRLYRMHPADLPYAQLTDPVAPLREFRLVYGYIFLTFGMLLGAIWATIRQAA